MKSKFYRVICFLLRGPAKLLFRVHVKGAKNEPPAESGPYLGCSNHQSNLDPVVICIATRRQQPHFMGKAEVFRVPLVGPLLRGLGAFPVSRGKSDVGAIKHTMALLESGRSVGMFPQGKRYRDCLPEECPIKFGAGMIVARTGVQVLPVHIKMKNYRWRFLRRIDVTVGKPIPFEDLQYQEGASGEYARITRVIYDEICRLGKEAE